MHAYSKYTFFKYTFQRKENIAVMTQRPAQSFIPIESERAFDDEEFLEEDRLELSSNSRRHLSSESDGDDGEGIVTLHKEIVEFYRLCFKAMRLNVYGMLSLVFQGHVTNSH